MVKRNKLIVWVVVVCGLAAFLFWGGPKRLFDLGRGLSLGFLRLEKRLLYSAQALSSFKNRLDVYLDVPFHRQEHALSCEIAALKMALNYYGVAVTESELLADLPFDERGPRGKNNVWGDPDVGFVGDIDGKIPDGGYGVYEKPIVNLAMRYRNAKAMRAASLRDVLLEVANGRPVIVWGSLASGQDISWKTKSGRPVKAVFGEHTRLIIGFSGTVDDPKAVLMLDPIYGRIVMSKNRFLANWALLGNRAVVVY